MKLLPPQTLAQIAEIIGAEFIGDPNHIVSGLNEIHRVQPGDLSFVDVEKYYKKCLNSAATTILINQKVAVPAGKAIIYSPDPFRDFNRLTQHFQPRRPVSDAGNPSIPDTALLGRNVVLGHGVVLGDNVQIGHNTVIGHHVVIGNDTVIHANVTIGDYTRIGAHTLIKAGASIGGDAFYFKRRPEGMEPLISSGYVDIGSHVVIGSNTTIDRGVSAITQIGDHTKIDNLVMVGHDTIIGQRCVVSAQVGIAGVTTIEDDVTLWGQVGISSDVVIGKGAVLLAKTGVIHSLEGGKTYFGMVGKEVFRSWREIACLEKLPDIIHKLENL